MAYSFIVLNTTQSAAKLKVSRSRIIALIAAGRLKATKVGRDWVIAEKDLAAVRVRKPGRPSTKGK